MWAAAVTGFLVGTAATENTGFLTSTIPAAGGLGDSTGHGDAPLFEHFPDPVEVGPAIPSTVKVVIGGKVYAIHIMPMVVALVEIVGHANVTVAEQAGIVAHVQGMIGSTASHTARAIEDLVPTIQGNKHVRMHDVVLRRNGTMVRVSAIFL